MQSKLVKKDMSQQVIFHQLETMPFFEEPDVLYNNHILAVFFELQNCFEHIAVQDNFEFTVTNLGITLCDCKT